MMDACLHQSGLDTLPVRVTLLETGTVVLKFGSPSTIGEVSIFVRSRADARLILDEMLARLDEIERGHVDAPQS